MVRHAAPAPGTKATRRAKELREALAASAAAHDLKAAADLPAGMFRRYIGKYLACPAFTSKLKSSQAAKAEKAVKEADKGDAAALLTRVCGAYESDYDQLPEPCRTWLEEQVRSPCPELAAASRSAPRRAVPIGVWVVLVFVQHLTKCIEGKAEEAASEDEQM
eukprot:TRINITY_DN4092_c0_g1_i1.p2 TRINITY_DN4092_c0_g1~~TRINITY_DN4092_c0_g1_i1.p2  ORF type:complete len:163 (-),score=53.82 TRINITY_DN4092_c0_g1_i1:32-520(-)